MVQLDLFVDASVAYNNALRCLANLDTKKCRAELAEHVRTFPKGIDPGPIYEAVSWLESLHSPTAEHAPFLLEACRSLREGDAPGFFDLGEGVARKAMKSLAKRVLDANRDCAPSTPLTSDLPWAIFHLFAGALREARPSLSIWAEGFPPVPAPSITAGLALGDILSELGRHEEARAAYRDAFGLAPGNVDWPIVDSGIRQIREATETDSLFADDWWVVGACLEGRLPAFGRLDHDRALRWYQRFEAALETQTPPAVIFFQGLRLSAQGLSLKVRELALVRSTLRRLHSEAYELHREQIARSKGDFALSR